MKITYHIDIIQGTDEWHALRRGIITASEMHKIMTAGYKPADNATSRTHAAEIAAQRITEYTEPSYVSDDMLRGHCDEVYARELYAEHYAPVDEVGFITAEIDGIIIGYSPDGTVGNDGLIEIKSRRQKHHIATICADAVPPEYMLQIQTGLLVTGRSWLDFISYCGGLPMFVKRVLPDEQIQASILEAVHAFESQVRDVMALYYHNAAGLHATERVEYGREIEIN